MASRSKQYYDANPTAKAKKKKYDTSYHSSPERRKYRSKLNKIRRKLGIYGKGGGDVSHTADGGYKIEDPSVNRGRQGSNKKTTKAKQGLRTRDPKVGTGKKPKGSDRRLYTDEIPKDTVGIKFATPSDARATVSKVMKISKPFARKIQILTVGEQRAKVMGKSEVVSIFKAGKQKLRAQNNRGVVKAKSGLAKWFAQDWVDIGSKKKGGGHKKCGRSGKDKEGRPYPKCVPAAKAARMTASQKESAVRRKRAAGNPGGKPTYVKTFAKQGIKISFKKNSDNMSKLEKRTTKKKVVKGSGTGEPKKPGLFRSKPTVFTTDTGVKAIKNRKGEVENLSMSSISPYLNRGLTPAEKRKALSSLQGAKKMAKGGKAFKPHMMYDPKTGKAFKANKPADHKRMSKMGYTHTKPKKKAGMGMKNKTYLYGGMVPKLGPAKKFISDSAPFETAVDKYYRSNR